MSTANTEKSRTSRTSYSTVSLERMPHPLGSSYSSILASSSVRRSPRAPGRVKVNFSDVLNGEAPKKKRSTSLTNTSNSEQSLPLVPGPKKTIDGREIDRYCWLCHKEGEDTFCSHCPRVFHFQCLGPAHRFTEDGVCPECRQVSTDGTELKDSLTTDRLSKLLPYALNRMVANVPVIKTWKYSEKESKDLVCAMDLPTLLQNINERRYKSTVSFLSDVKWILHNFTILHGVTQSITLSSKSFVKICRTEMLDIEACPDCYQHAYTLDDEKWFSQLCNVNHTLVWAKLKGFPFWPSKAVKVIDGIADVRFFGSHEKGRLPVGQCYRLSVENPNDRPPKNANFRRALEELDIYIKNVNNKFGQFKYFPPQSVYDPGSENHNTKQPAKRKSDLLPSSKSKKTKLSNASKNATSTDKRKSSDVGLKEKDAPRLLNGSSSSSNTHSKGRKSGRWSFENELSQKSRLDLEDSLESSDVECINNVSQNKSKFMKHLELNNRNSPEWSMGAEQNVVSAATATKDNSHSEIRNVQNSPNSENGITTPCVTNGEVVIDLTSADSSERSNNELMNCRSEDMEVSESSRKEDSVEASEITEVEKTSSSRSKDIPCSEGQEEDRSNKISETAVQDTVSSVLDSLEFFEDDEASASVVPNILKQESVFIEDSNVMDISNGNLSNDLGQVSEHAASSASISTGLHISDTQAPNNVPQEIPSNNVETMGAHEPGIMYRVPVNSADPQGQVCFVPLPKELTLEKYQSKVYSMVRATVEEIWHDYVNTPNISRLVLALQKEMEDMKRKHQQDMSDISSNTDLILQDIKSSMELEKQNAVEEIKKRCELEKQQAIAETKKKQWCANCSKPAIFYCCWNTSYCNYDCQAAHWREHMHNCTQSSENNEQHAAKETRSVANSHNSETSKKHARKLVSGSFVNKQRNRKILPFNFVNIKDNGAPSNSAQQHPLHLSSRFLSSRVTYSSRQFLKSTASNSPSDKRTTGNPPLGGPLQPPLYFRPTSVAKSPSEVPCDSDNPAT